MPNLGHFEESAPTVGCFGGFACRFRPHSRTNAQSIDRARSSHVTTMSNGTMHSTELSSAVSHPTSEISKRRHIATVDLASEYIATAHIPWRGIQPFLRSKSFPPAPRYCARTLLLNSAKRKQILPQHYEDFSDVLRKLHMAILTTKGEIEDSLYKLDGLTTSTPTGSACSQGCASSRD